MDDEITARLREAYDRQASTRDQAVLQPWKLHERAQLLDLLHAEGCRSLLELGAGTGHDGQYFQDHGLEVTCIDLSPAMVTLCHAKGLRAFVQDLRHLMLPAASFDAVHGLNCLLHIPKRDLPGVLGALRQVLRPGGLGYLGLYGGDDFEGVYPEDPYEPKRFFSYHTDAGIYAAVQPFFEILSFYCIPVSGTDPSFHFQSLWLRGTAGWPR